MLPKRQRLTSSEVVEVFHDSNRVHTEELTALWRPADTGKVAVVAPKKIFKKAHLRNLVRRRMFHLLVGTSLPNAHVVFLVTSDHPQPGSLEPLLDMITKRRHSVSVLES